MGFNDHLLYDGTRKYREKCPKCGNIFEVFEIEQEPGFRTPDSKFCPYCSHVIKRSMEYEYITSKINDNDKR